MISTDEAAKVFRWVRSVSKIQLPSYTNYMPDPALAEFHAYSPDGHRDSIRNEQTELLVRMDAERYCMRGRIAELTYKVVDRDTVHHKVVRLKPGRFEPKTAIYFQATQLTLLSDDAGDVMLRLCAHLRATPEANDL